MAETDFDLTERQVRAALANCSQQERALLKALAQSEDPSQAFRLIELKHEFPAAQLVENRPGTPPSRQLQHVGSDVARDEKMSQQLADEGTARSTTNVTEEWKFLAMKAIEKVCRTKATFTPDDVWSTGLEKPGTPQALGNMMQKARAQGWCLPTGEYVPSTVPSQHKNPIRVWKSLLIPEEGTLL